MNKIRTPILGRRQPISEFLGSYMHLGVSEWFVAGCEPEWFMAAMRRHFAWCGEIGGAEYPSTRRPLGELAQGDRAPRDQDRSDRLHGKCGLYTGFQEL